MNPIRPEQENSFETEPGVRILKRIWGIDKEGKKPRNSAGQVMADIYNVPPTMQRLPFGKNPP